MRLFDSSQINQLILAALKESPLKQADIVEKISVQLELTQEEREEKEIYSNMGIFYHKIAGQIQSLKRSGLIIHDDETKAWKILDIGKTELSNFDRVIDNNSVCNEFNKKNGWIPQKIKKEDLAVINHLSLTKDKELVVIDINPDPRANPTESINRKIELVQRKYAKGKNVRGVIIKQISKTPKNTYFSEKEHLIDTIYYKIKLDIFDNQKPRFEGEVIPTSENAFSNYLVNNLGIIETNLHKDNNINKAREFHVFGRRSIDVLCRDNNDRLVVIENKTNTNTEYGVVGQILYYLQRLKSLESFSNDEIRGIILIPNSNSKDKTQTIKDALEGARKDLNIMLKFFSLTISFT